MEQTDDTRFCTWLSTLDKDTQAFYHEAQRTMRSDPSDEAYSLLWFFAIIYSCVDRCIVPVPSPPPGEQNVLSFARWIDKEGKTVSDQYTISCDALRVREIYTTHKRYTTYVKSTLGALRCKEVCPNFCPDGILAFEGQNPVTLDTVRAKLGYSGTDGLCMSVHTGSLYPISAVRDMFIHEKHIRMDTGVVHATGDFIDLTSTEWTDAMGKLIKHQHHEMMKKHKRVARQICHNYDTIIDQMHHKLQQTQMKLDRANLTRQRIDIQTQNERVAKRARTSS